MGRLQYGSTGPNGGRPTATFELNDELLSDEQITERINAPSDADRTPSPDATSMVLSKRAASDGFSMYSTDRK